MVLNRKSHIPISALHELLSYDSETGAFFWKYRHLKYCPSETQQKRWNTRYANKKADSARDKLRGYRKLCILGQTYAAHRVAWAMHYGEWPGCVIDHIDGNPANNEIANLRAVDHVINARNRAVTDSNQCGIMGVRWDGKREKWRVSVSTDKAKNQHIGFYDELLHAQIAAQAAYKAAGYHDNHGRPMSYATDRGAKTND